MPMDFAASIGDEIDGRPLHLYRLSERRFDELEIGLRSGLGRSRDGETAAAFVLWAAEHYRRNFAGGSFSWAFLADELGLSLDQATLRDLTARGLRKLRRPPPRSSDAGVQYLRTLAAEGGLPVRLLANEGGYRAALVGLVADLERFGAGCPEEQALAFARRRAERLPMGYRTEEFHGLFVQFARELVDLRGRAPRDLAAADVESWLDRAEPAWRERLTLRFDGDAARALFAEAMTVRAGGEVDEPLGRQLVRDEDGAWRAFVDVAPATRLPARLMDGIDAAYRRVRLAPTGALAAACPDLMLALDREEGGWSATRISGRRTARFPFPLSAPIELVAMADGRLLQPVSLPGGGAVDPAEGLTLWTLAESGEDGAARRLAWAGSASLRTRDPFVWALVGANARVTCSEGLVAQPGGESAEGRLLRLEGKGRIGVRDWSLAVETGADRTERDEIAAFGAQDSTVRDGRGVPVFRGLPDIALRRAGHAFVALPTRRRLYRSGGRGAWRRSAPEESFLGTLDVAAEEDGNVGARLRLRILPPAARFAMDAGGEALSVSGLPAGWTLRVEDATPAVINEAGSAQVPLFAGGVRKARLRLRAAAPDGAETLDWQLALPATRAYLAGPDGSILETQREITLHDLRDWRVLPALVGQTDLSLRLVAPGLGGITSPLAVRVHGEAPLSSVRDLVDDLLSHGGPDAEVRLRALADGHESPRLLVRRFLGETNLTEDGVILRTQGAPGDERTLLDLVAINIDAPGPAVAVPNAPPAAIGNVLGPGRWFFLPSLHGQPLRPPRPLVVEPVAGQEATTSQDDRLHAAGAGRTRAARVEAYAAIFRDGGDLQHLMALERTIDALTTHGASPSALDQVLALQRVSAVAVRLLMRADVSDLSDRLELERHGARRWAFVAPRDWGAAVAAELASLTTSLAAIPALAERAETLAREQMARRVREILTLRPDLDGHLALGLMEARLAAPPDLMHWLGRMPSAFGDPEGTLLRLADAAARRHGESDLSFPDLRVAAQPAAFVRFADHVNGLIEAPLFVSEVAFGLRAAPQGRTGVQLLRCIHLDPSHFDLALPAAMAWQAMRLSRK